MAAPVHCTGTLMWYDVPFDDRPMAGLLECSDCGYVVVTGTINDDRHWDAPVVRG